MNKTDLLRIIWSITLVVSLCSIVAWAWWPVPQWAACPICHRDMYTQDSVVNHATIWHERQEDPAGGLNCRFGSAAICTECWDRLSPGERFKACLQHVCTYQNRNTPKRQINEDVIWLQQCAKACWMTYDEYERSEQ